MPSSRSSGSPGSSKSTFVGMTPGDGENSYAKNSQVQRMLADRLLPSFFDVIKYFLRLPGVDSPFRIADLGCSSGPNTITNVGTIIEQVRMRYRDEEMDENPLEIQVFFQDLPCNDFNTLFKHLFSQPSSDVESAQNYMSAAVPGSFSDRLLPKSTINIAMSFFALHYLSQVPGAVTDRASLAYNGGHTDIHRSSLATVQAYAEQADKDLDNFLAARAHEIASGGVMFLAFPVREGFFPYQSMVEFHLEEEVWNDLVVEGLVTEELRDCYNCLVYIRTLDEVTKKLEEYNSVFEVQKQEVVPVTSSDLCLGNTRTSPRERARTLVKTSRGVATGSYEAYFGKTATDVFYERWEEALCELFARRKSDTDGEGQRFMLLTLSLLRM